MRFPSQFWFGTATSATQIEGGCANTDWYEFARSGRAHGDSLDVACDHWHRFREDIALQARLGLCAHRMSLEWARIEPEPGRFDDEALERYRSELMLLRENGIEPFVTLHHFSWPLWLSRRGGALAPEMPEQFASYTRRVARALSDQVRHWLTINEPNVLVAQGHLFGLWPPAEQNPAHVVRAVLALRSAHQRAYRAIHEVVPNAEVGLAHHVRLATPATPRIRDRAAARVLDWAFNRVFLDLPQDYIGLNYYTRDVVRFAPARAAELFLQREVGEGAELNDLGWEIYPAGLGILLRDLARYKKPIYITENGIADRSDEKRGPFLLAHLRETAHALAAGVDVRGYFHWSLLDNFEWAEGYAPRFGLYQLDYQTQERTLRPSGELYAQIVRARACD